LFGSFYQQTSLPKALPSTGQQRYFRLKQMAFDGKETYFGVIHVEMEQVGGAKVYPNPVSGHELSVAIEREAIREISIYDQQGRHWQRVVFPETHIALMEVGFLPAGMYTFAITTENRTVYKRVLRQ
jgi:hypothetical protein